MALNTATFVGTRSYKSFSARSPVWVLSNLLQPHVFISVEKKRLLHSTFRNLYIYCRCNNDSMYIIIIERLRTDKVTN